MTEPVQERTWSERRTNREVEARYYAVDELARMLGRSAKTIRRWHRERRLPGGVRLVPGGQLQFRRDVVRKWLAEVRQRTGIEQSFIDVPPTSVAVVPVTRPAVKESGAAPGVQAKSTDPDW